MSDKRIRIWRLRVYLWVNAIHILTMSTCVWWITQYSVKWIIWRDFLIGEKAEDFWLGPRILDEVSRIITKTSIFFLLDVKLFGSNNLLYLIIPPQSTGSREFLIESLCICRVPKLEVTLRIVWSFFHIWGKGKPQEIICSESSRLLL